MERLMAAFDIARNIGSVVGLLILLDAELPLAFGVDGGGDRNADGEDDRQDDVELLPARGVDGGDARDVERGEDRHAEVDEDRHAGGSEDDLASAQVGVGLAAFVSSTQDIDIYLVKQERARSTDGVRS
jgi:hypothetical protein